MISDLDLQVAGIALARQCVLASHNRRHFGRIVDPTVEDWLAA